MSPAPLPSGTPSALSPPERARQSRDAADTSAPIPVLSLVVPVHNEGMTIAGTLTAWLGALTSTGVAAEFVVVDDGSTDATPGILDAAAAGDARLRVVHQPQGGHAKAVLTGYRAARGTWIFQFDGDDEIGASFFDAMWARRGEAPLVLGERDGSQRAWLRRQLTRLAGHLISVAGGQPVIDPNVPFRLVTRAALDRVLARMPEGLFAPNVAMTLLVAMSGEAIIRVPVVEHPRHVARRPLAGWRLYRGAARALVDTVALAVRESRQRRR